MGLLSISQAQARVPLGSRLVAGQLLLPLVALMDELGAL